MMDIHHYFKFQRACHQEDPLSRYVFIISFELLSLPIQPTHSVY